MTIIKSISFTALATLFLLAGAVQAAGHMGGGRGPMSFSDLDKNGDGMISREEFSATHRNRVETQTQNQDMGGSTATPPMAPPAAGMEMQMQQQSQEQMQQQTQQRMRPANMPSYGDYDLDGDGKCEVHCNTVECTWSWLRQMVRTYRGVSKVYLPLYVAQFEFMFNRRHHNRWNRTLDVLQTLFQVDTSSAADLLACVQTAQLAEVCPVVG